MIAAKLPKKTVSQVRNYWMNHHGKYRLKKLCPPGMVGEKGYGKKNVSNETMG